MDAPVQSDGIVVTTPPTQTQTPAKGATPSTTQTQTPTNGATEHASPPPTHDPPCERLKPAPGQTYEFPLLIEDDEFDNQGAVSDNETLDTSVPAVDESFVYGTACEKVDEYDGYLDEQNPWHPDLAKPLLVRSLDFIGWPIATEWVEV